MPADSRRRPAREHRASPTRTTARVRRLFTPLLLRHRFSDACSPAREVPTDEARRLAARDAPGLGVSGPVALAHRRLSIIKITSGRQPMIDAERGRALICNGGALQLSSAP